MYKETTFSLTVYRSKMSTNNQGPLKKKTYKHHDLFLVISNFRFVLKRDGTKNLVVIL